MDAFLPFVRGVGTGATMGLHKYPSAGIMMALDKLMGEGNLSFGEALQVINDQQANDRETNPVASYGGQVVGSLVPAGNMVRAGANIARMVPAGAVGMATGIGSGAVIGAGQGAIGGFNERQDLGDAAIGAGLGTVLGGASSTLGAVGNKAIRETARKVAERHYGQANAARSAQVARLGELTTEAKILQSAGLQPTKAAQAEARKVKNSIQGFSTSAARANNVIDEVIDPAINNANFADTAGRYLLGATKSNTIGARAIKGDVGATIGTAGLGGLLGAGGAYALDKDPLMGFLLGSGTFGATRSLHGPLLQTGMGVAAKAPARAMGAGVLPLALQAGGPGIPAARSAIERAGTSELDAEFDRYLPVQEAPVPRKTGKAQPPGSAASSPQTDFDAEFESYLKK